MARTCATTKDASRPARRERARRRRLRRRPSPTAACRSSRSPARPPPTARACASSASTSCACRSTGAASSRRAAATTRRISIASTRRSRAPARAGVFVLIDLHQDAYSKEIGEDGAPLWAIAAAADDAAAGPAHRSRRRAAPRSRSWPRSTRSSPPAIASGLQAAFIDDARPRRDAFRRRPGGARLRALQRAAGRRATLDRSVLVRGRAGACARPRPTSSCSSSRPRPRNLLDFAPKPSAPFPVANAVYAPHIYTYVFDSDPTPLMNAPARRPRGLGRRRARRGRRLAHAARDRRVRHRPDRDERRPLDGRAGAAARSLPRERCVLGVEGRIAGVVGRVRSRRATTLDRAPADRRLAVARARRAHRGHGHRERVRLHDAHAAPRDARRRRALDLHAGRGRRRSRATARRSRPTRDAATGLSEVPCDGMLDVTP